MGAPSEAPGLDALLKGLGSFVGFYALYFGYYVVAALLFTARVQRAFDGGAGDSGSSLPVSELLIGFVAAALLFGFVTCLEAHQIDVAVATSDGSTHAASLSAVFPESLITFVLAFPAVLLFLAGANAAWNRDIESIADNLAMGVEMGLEYLFAGALVTIGFVAVVGHGLDTVPLVGFVDPHLVIENPLWGVAVGFGYPLVFGTSGAIVGNSLNALIGGINRD